MDPIVTPSTDFLALSASELLAEFGAGRPSPGSGSAAALMGLLSASLVSTVCSLSFARTGDPNIRQTLEAHRVRADGGISAELRLLFQEDAEVFDQVVVYRKRRDAAAEGAESQVNGELALEQLRRATEIPQRIGDLCIELVEIALEIHQLGYRAVRGDSIAAASAALAGARTSHYVVRMNLESFGNGDWESLHRAEEMRRAQDLEICCSAMDRAVARLG